MGSPGTTLLGRVPGSTMAHLMRGSLSRLDEAVFSEHAAQLLVDE